MGIGIDDHDFDAGLSFLEVADGDGDVVEDAVSLAVFAEGVVGSAGEADADAFFEGREAGEACGFDFGGAALEEAGSGGEAEKHLFLAVEQAGFDFCDVVEFVDAAEEEGVCGADLDDFLGFEDAAIEEHVLGYAELVHGERVSRGQFKFEFV